MPVEKIAIEVVPPRPRHSILRLALTYLDLAGRPQGKLSRAPFTTSYSTGTAVNS